MPKESHLKSEMFITFGLPLNKLPKILRLKDVA